MKTGQRAGLVRITPELLWQSLQLPDHHRIIDVSWDKWAHCIILHVIGPNMPERNEGEELRDAELWIHDTGRTREVPEVTIEIKPPKPTFKES